MGDVFKGLVILIVAFFVLGFAFNVLFKIGLLILLGLGILYLVKLIFGDRYWPFR